MVVSNTCNPNTWEVERQWDWEIKVILNHIASSRPTWTIYRTLSQKSEKEAGCLRLKTKLNQVISEQALREVRLPGKPDPGRLQDRAYLRAIVCYRTQVLLSASLSSFLRRHPLGYCLSFYKGIWRVLTQKPSGRMAGK